MFDSVVDEKEGRGRGHRAQERRGKTGVDGAQSTGEGVAGQDGSPMVAGGLQACLERVEGIEREVDGKACDGTGLAKSTVNLLGWLDGGGRAYNEGPSPQRCHQRWSKFHWERAGLSHGRQRLSESGNL